MGSESPPFIHLFIYGPSAGEAISCCVTVRRVSDKFRNAGLSMLPVAPSSPITPTTFRHKGKYAAVRRCRERATGQQYAAKFLRKRRRSTDLRPEILHEVAVLEACASSPRIVRLHQVFESAHEMILLLELSPEFTATAAVAEWALYCYIYGPVDDGEFRPQNLVLTAEFPLGEVKLCDLGISRYISPGADIRDILGTPDYVAPEVLNYESISLSTDMWSVGVIMYVLLTGFSPFGGDTKQETFCNISQCRLDFPDDLFEDVSEDAKDLMRKLMVKEPSKRLSAEDCMKHPWFLECDPQPLPRKVPSLLTNIKSCEKVESICTNVSPVAGKKLEVYVSQEKTLNLSKLNSKSPAAIISSLTTTTTTTFNAREVKTVSNKINTDIKKVPTVPTSLESISTEFSTGKRVTRNRGSSGMSSFRKNTFKKRMESLKQNYVEESNENNNNNDILTTKQTNDNTIDNRSTFSLNGSLDSKTTSSTVENRISSSSTIGRTVNKALAVQTMPVNSLVELNKVDSKKTVVPSREVNLNISSGIRRSNNVQRRPLDKDNLFTFRKCIIIGDSEDESADSVPLQPRPVHCSMNSIGSDSGLGSFSDHSSSDCSSDTVSEMSIDSSSDRSSIISLDDSLMECSYVKVNGRPYPGSSTYSSSYSKARSIWETPASNNKNETLRVTHAWPRESKSTFSKVFTKFNSQLSQEEIRSVRNLQTNLFPSVRRQAPKYAHTSALNHVLITAVSNNDKFPTVKKVDVMREQNGNLVVIREAKPDHNSLVINISVRLKPAGELYKIKISVNFFQSVADNLVR
uniref:Protein kinase domain-containing protein n=1 Tax=Timema monikensis TaxID=170555 RepID=A0A7R9E083_9NEOP|nr:unnamed protein product [Timema monikensis]